LRGCSRVFVAGREGMELSELVTVRRPHRLVLCFAERAANELVDTELSLLSP